MPLTRPHVAVLMAASHLGGAERSLLALVRHASAFVRFTLILPADGELAAHATAAGAAVHVAEWPRELLTLGEQSARPGIIRLSTVFPRLATVTARVRRVIATLDPDVLVTNGIKPHVIGTLVAMSSPRLPLIWYLRESVEGRTVARTVLRRLSPRCNGAIAISRYVERDAATYLAATVPVQVSANIVELDPGIEDGGTELRKPPGECWFASIGALTPLKGHDVFLRAAAIVHGEEPSTRFLIAGGNQYATEQGTGYGETLRTLARDLGLDGVATFLGHRTDVAALLRQIDVLVQSNTGPEGFGRSVVEAMRAGVPVIASRGWSFPELIEDGRTGWLVPPGDVTALAACMLAAARDAKHRRDIGGNGQTSARAGIRADQSVDDFTSMLQRVLAPRRDPGAHHENSASRQILSA